MCIHTIECPLIDLIQFDAKSPMAAILEMRVSDRPEFMRMNSTSNWTDDESFAECIKSRFDAKNKRAMRARISKHKRENLQAFNLQLPSSYAPLFDAQHQSQSDSSLLNRPLLSNQTAINESEYNTESTVSAQ